MRATALLTKQHDEVRSIFKQLAKGNGASQALLGRLSTNLVAHMVIEQEIFYPAVMKVDEGLVLESYEEHEVARFALARLMKARVTDRTFKAKVVTLKEIVEHHMEEEENDLFPAAEKALGEGASAVLAKMKARFDTIAKAGYQRAVGRGGSAVTSARAPEADAR